MTVIKPSEVSAPAEVKELEVIRDEQKVAEMTINKYMEAVKSGDMDELVKYMSSKMRENTDNPSSSIGATDLHLGKWEIISSQKMSEEEFKFTIREYQERSGSGVIGYSENEYAIINIDGEYLIDSIGLGDFIVAIETADWMIFSDEEKTIEYKYPEDFFLQEPEISIARMANGSSLDGCYTRNFGGFTVKKVKIGDVSYCLTESNEKSEGSTYIDSSYTNVEGERIITLHFIARYDDCVSLGAKTEVGYINCERSNMSGPGIVEKVVETFRFVPKEINQENAD
jgi:hypothetical protein